MIHKHILAATIAVMIFAACSSSSNDTYPESSYAPKATLTTRVTTDPNAEINTALPYPIALYAFDANGACASAAQIDQEDDADIMTLNAGSYTVAAIAGCSIAADASNMTTDAVIVNSPSVGSDLQIGTQNVTLAAGEEKSCNITLKRQVLMLAGIQITDVPNNIATVQVCLDNLYTSLAINGKMDGNGSQSFQLANDGNGTWKYSATTYLLPSHDNAELSLYMIDIAGNDKTYTLKLDEAFEANYQYAINLAYTPTNEPEEEEVRLQIQLAGAQWLGKKEVTISFGEDAKTETTPAADAPTAGTLYKGAYVLGCTTIGRTTTVTLMSTTVAKCESSGTSFSFGGKSYDFTDASKQDNWTTCMNKLIPAMTQELTDAGITGWHAPTYDEACYLADHREETRTSLLALACEAKDFSTSYLPICNNGQYVRFKFEDKSTIDYTSAKPGSVLYLRAFTTLTFTK